MSRTLEFTFTVEDDEGDEIGYYLPGKVIVCTACGGRGSRVNPAIDGNGLSREDFDEDPDFEEAYWRGDYDQPCPCCHGQNVEIEPDESYRSVAKYAEEWAAYDRYLENQIEQARYDAEDRYTRRMESGGRE